MGPHPVDRTSAAPLWTQLQDDLQRRIQRGEFDHSFPGELALTEEYGLSRNTVRQALAHLRADGVVTAERGRAPQVAGRDTRRGIEQPVGAATTLFDAVESTGRRQTSVVRTLGRTADGVIAARLGLEESTPLLFLDRVRLADDEPLAWDRVWLPYAEASPLLEADLSHTALYRELARCTGLRVDSGRERVHAASATAAESHLLGIDNGAAVLRIERAGCHDGRLVEWRQTAVRGDRFTLTAAFGRTQGWQLSGVADGTGDPVTAPCVALPA